MSGSALLGGRAWGAPSEVATLSPAPDLWSDISLFVPAELLDNLQAAVDPLELAATLETCGLSNSVARHRLGFSDIFAVARELLAQLPDEPVSPVATPEVRSGNSDDLARGLVFALPALAFAGGAISLRRELPWWALPLALICGWALSQCLACAGYILRARNEPTGSTVIICLSVAVVGCSVLAVLGGLVLGRLSALGVTVAVGDCLFMTASAVLVLHQKIRALLWTLIPGAFGATLFFAVGSSRPVGVLAASLTGVSVVAVLWSALRLPHGGWHRARLLRYEQFRVTGYGIHGVMSGLAVTTFVTLTARSLRPVWSVLVTFPLILSLGWMEWQLHSFRARSSRATRRSMSMRMFRRDVTRVLLRSIFAYFVAELAVAVVLAGIAFLASGAMPSLELADCVVLGLIFYLALLTSACGRISPVLKAWLIGVLPFLGWLLLAPHIEGLGSIHNPRTDLVVFSVGAVASALAMTGVARAAAIDPFNHP